MKEMIKNIIKLNELCSSIFKAINKPMRLGTKEQLEEPLLVDNLILYYDEEQAEINGTQDLEIKERLVLHERYYSKITSKA